MKLQMIMEGTPLELAEFIRGLNGTNPMVRIDGHPHGFPDIPKVPPRPDERDRGGSRDPRDTDKS